jgi:hypothetical protein
MGWLGAAFQTAVPMLAGRYQGQVQGEQLAYDRRRDEEERQARLAQQAMQQQLLQAQMAHMQGEEARAANPMPAWRQAGYGSAKEQLTYEGALSRLQHPERYEQPDRDAQTPWAKAGFPDQTSYLEYLGKASRAENPQRFEKPAGAGASDFDPNDPQNHQKFLTAYLQRTGQGHQNPATLTWEPPAPPESRIRDAEAAYQEMVRLTSAEYNPADDAPAEDDPNAPPDTFTLPGLLRMHGFGADSAAGPIARPEDSLLHTSQPADPTAGPPGTPAPATAPADSAGSPAAFPASGDRTGLPSALFSPAGRAAAAIVHNRVRQMKRAGVSKEEGYRRLLEEGLVDAAGNIVVDTDGLR